MTQPNRLADGLLDRTRSLSFRFDGRDYVGHPGDTLASALLANGVRLMGRSFKYHRPRGPVSAGSEEPNALVTLRHGARADPNSRATMAELFDGLQAQSQNRWPSLAFDAMAINDRFAALLTAGFYYKTFMWPSALWERLYEPLIRRAAGLGRLSGLADPDVYDKGFLHCDLLVIGAGPSGLMAALSAGRAGARVILADEDFRMGGRLNLERLELDGMSGADWAAQAIAELAALPTVRLMPRCTVIGAFDHGVYGALERHGDHLANPPAGRPRQTLWRIRSRRALLCAGATERPIAFADNDRPGIMLAGALRAYANRWGVAVGRKVAIFTNNDDGLRSAADLESLGAEVVTVVDTRKGEVITGTRGRLGLRGITLRDSNGRTREVACDALGVSGGWNPNLHLTSHHRGRPVWNDTIAAFLPGADMPAGLSVAGAAAGLISTHAALVSGAAAAGAALADLGFDATPPQVPQAEDAPVAITPFWHVPGKRRAWIDLQNDVTVKDVGLAHQEGYRSVEHLKRYTTLGMATDQGRTGNVLGLAVMAGLTGAGIAGTGTTIYRPPYSPVAIGAFAGRSRGRQFRPTRLTPTHRWATQQGATFIEAGAWLRTQFLPRPAETGWEQTVAREVSATRNGVGICDVSTLGKIDIQGRDAGAFLDRVYANTFSTLKVGKVRYGLMLREDGFVMDDGTTARLGQDHYLMTTTTSNAVAVFRHLEFCRQCLWPEMDIQLMSVTESWAQLSVAGPKARALLQRIVDQDISDAAFPYMGCGAVTVCGGLRARLFRISFSGELAYEIAVPARHGEALLRRLMDEGAAYDAVVYGTESLGVMRIEKGHVAGAELNGQTTALNIGLGRMVSPHKDAIGRVLSQRPALSDPDGLRLVGLRPSDASVSLLAGARLMAPGAEPVAANDQGWVSSTAFSPSLGHGIALAFLKRGASRHGERLNVVDLLSGATHLVEVVSPHFIDPEGERLRA